MSSFSCGDQLQDVRRRSRENADMSESILSARSQLLIGWQGLVMTAAVLGLYYAVAPVLAGTTAEQARTMMFSALVLTQLLHAFDFRSATVTVWHPDSLKNRWLVLSLAGSMALQATIIYVPALSSIFKTAPLSAMQWVAVVMTGLVAVLVIDATNLTLARLAARSQGSRR